MTNNLNLSKLPPQALKIEAEILGIILTEPNRHEDVFNILTNADIFYKQEHHLIFTAMLKIWVSGGKIDILSVINRLGQTGDIDKVGGNYAVMQLAETKTPGGHVENHCRLILEKWMKREVIRLAGEAITQAYADDDVFEIIEGIDKSLQGVNDAISEEKYFEPMDLLPEVFEDLETAKELQGGLSGVDTGIPTLNSVTNGWQKSDHIVLAARPAGGKTAFALNMLLNAAKSGIPTVMFSLEMKAKALVRRCLAILAGVDLKKIKNGTVTPEDENNMDKVASIFSKLPITIIDTAGLTGNQIVSRARKLKRKGKCEFVIVDYLQLVRPNNPKDTREQQVAQLSWGFKTMAKELDIPVLDLCQMNRSVEHNKRRPVMSDLRESGSIEQDADLVIFLHHEEQDDSSFKNLIVIAKFRDGEAGVHELRFIKDIQKWTDVDDFAYANKPSFQPFVQQANNNSKNFDDDVPF